MSIDTEYETDIYILFNLFKPVFVIDTHNKKIHRDTYVLEVTLPYTPLSFVLWVYRVCNMCLIRSRQM